jgi:hypothetical protein
MQLSAAAPLIAATAAIAAVHHAGWRNRHSGLNAAVRKRHSITPLKNFYSSNRGHDVDLC